MKRIFKDWIMGRYTIYNDKYSLWICNGFMFFEDDNEFRNSEPFLSLLGFWGRLKLWLELQREKKIRAKEIIDSFK